MFDYDPRALLAEALLAAVERRDGAALREALGGARGAGGDAMVESILADADADGCTLLHRCCGAPLEPAAPQQPPGDGDSQEEDAAATAAQCGRIAKQLIVAKADVDATNLLGETPLISAARCPAHRGLVCMLLAARADPDRAESLTGETALMEAARGADSDLCRTLLDSRADPTKTNSLGLNAWELAATTGGAGADDVIALPGMRAAEEEKLRPLRAAVEACDGALVASQVEALGAYAEAALRAVDADGKTVLEVAVDVGCNALADERSALRSVRALLGVRAAPDGPWRCFSGDGCALSRAVGTPVGRAICQELRAAGVELPWLGDRELGGGGGGGNSSECAAAGAAADTLGGEENIGEAAGGGDGELEKRCLDELRKECRNRGLPVERTVERSILVDRLRKLRAFERLPTADLRKECRERGAAVLAESTPENGDRHHDRASEAPATERRELIRCLTDGICEVIWEAKGVPVRRLACRDAAAALFEALQDLDEMDLLELEAENARLGLPPAEESPDYVSRLRTVRTWSRLPFPELLNECEERGVSTRALSWRSDEETQQELVGRLQERMCASLWQAKGVPMEQLGSFEAASKVLEEARRFQAMSFEALMKEYSEFGLPVSESGPQLGAADLRARLRTLLVWKEMPLNDLRCACRELRCPSWRVEQREQLVRQIAIATWVAPPEEAPPCPEFKSSGPPPHFDNFRSRFKPRYPEGSPKGSRNIPPTKAERDRDDLAMHFRTLKLPPTANQSDIKRAYRTLALQYHPDKNPGSAQELAAMKFREAKDAYEALSQHMSKSVAKRNRRP